MAISLVQSAAAGSGAASASSKAVTWSGNTTAGNLIVVVVPYYDDGHTGPQLISGITDSQGNTYKKAVVANHNANAGAEIWYATNIIGGVTPTVTVTFSQTARMGVFIREYTIVNSNSPLDIVNSGSVTAQTSWSVGPSSTTTKLNELVVVGMAANENHSNDWTLGAGYGNLQQRLDQISGGAEDKVILATGAQTALATNIFSTSGVMALATFAPVVSNLKSLSIDGLILSPGYTLNGIVLKNPINFAREYLYSSTDSVALNGKLLRDRTSNKEKYTLVFQYLTKTQVDQIKAIVALNRAVTFIVNDKNLNPINTIVWPYLSAVVYDTLGSEYRASLQLDLVEQNAQS